MSLPEIWFLLIAFFFTGYFVLEGFDFGVGALLPVIGKDNVGRRVMINTIGPVWDANETWLIVAGASMFAAFPYWYASAFSGFYLPLLIILFALIIRGVAFEYRGKVDSARWRAQWDVGIIVASILVPLLWGVAFANMIAGVELDANGNFTGSLLSMLGIYPLLGGVTMLVLCLCHGSIYVALRTVGQVRHSARQLGGRIGLGAIVLLAIFGIWTAVIAGASLWWTVFAVAALVAALVFNAREQEGWAFGFTAASMIGLVAIIFTALFPNLVRASNNPAFTITIENASSTPSTLATMTWVAITGIPFVIAFQVWTYWVFRQRIGRGSIPAKPQHGAETGTSRTHLH